MTQTVLFTEPDERTRFIELVAQGTPFDLAGFEVGWTPFKLRKQLDDEWFMEIAVAAQDRSLDSVERKVHQLAMAGNLGAAQMILYNRRPNVWRDLKRIEVNTHSTIEVVQIDATKAAIMAALREGGPEVVQIGTGFDRNADAIETTAVAIDED